MKTVRLVGAHTFYQVTERIKVNAEVAGVIYAKHEGITIVPHVVDEGENSVIAIRNDKLVTIQDGEQIGIVVPVETESLDITSLVADIAELKGKLTALEVSSVETKQQEQSEAVSAEVDSTESKKESTAK
jgi:hypothetical protein